MIYGYGESLDGCPLLSDAQLAGVSPDFRYLMVSWVDDGREIGESSLSRIAANMQRYVRVTSPI